MRVIPELLIDEIPFLIFLPILSSRVSTRRLLSISIGSLFFNSFPYEFANEFIVQNGGNDKSGLVPSIALGAMNPPDCIILEN